MATKSFPNNRSWCSARFADFAVRLSRMEKKYLPRTMIPTRCARAAHLSANTTADIYYGGVINDRDTSAIWFKNCYQPNVRICRVIFGCNSRYLVRIRLQDQFLLKLYPKINELEI